MIIIMLGLLVLIEAYEKRSDMMPVSKEFDFIGKIGKANTVIADTDVLMDNF